MKAGAIVFLIGVLVAGANTAFGVWTFRGAFESGLERGRGHRASECIERASGCDGIFCREWTEGALAGCLAGASDDGICTRSTLLSATCADDVCEGMRRALVAYCVR